MSNEDDDGGDDSGKTIDMSKTGLWKPTFEMDGTEGSGRLRYNSHLDGQSSDKAVCPWWGTGLTGLLGHELFVTSEAQ
jgi:hypothetical protein